MSKATPPGHPAGHNFLPHPDPMTHFLEDVLSRLQVAHESGRISDADMELLLHKTRETYHSVKDLFTHIVLSLL